VCSRQGREQVATVVAQVVVQTAVYLDSCSD